jgi:hypothetical protein
MIGFWGMASLLAIAVDVAAGVPRLRGWLVRSRWLPGVVAAVAGSALLALSWRTPGMWVRAWDNARVLLPYLGWPVAVGAVFGGGCLVWRRRDVSRDLLGFVVFLVLVSAMLTIRKFVAPIYPWATRRYLPYAVLVFPVLCAWALACLWSAGRAWQGVGRVAAVMALVGLVAGNARRSWHAWSRTEYDGVSEVMAEVASRVGDEDVLVVDHAWWGTPLLLVYDRRVLSGQHIYERKPAQRRPVAMRAFRRLHAGGHRVRFLTCTHDGLRIYRMPFKEARLDWESEAVRFRELVHAGRASDYVLRERDFKFRLYTWAP